MCAMLCVAYGGVVMQEVLTSFLGYADRGSHRLAIILTRKNIRCYLCHRPFTLSDSAIVGRRTHEVNGNVDLRAFKMRDVVSYFKYAHQKCWESQYI